jgi:hypothetical protein
MTSSDEAVKPATGERLCTVTSCVTDELPALLPTVSVTW